MIYIVGVLLILGILSSLINVCELFVGNTIEHLVLHCFFARSSAPSNLQSPTPVSPDLWTMSEAPQQLELALLDEREPTKQFLMAWERIVFEQIVFEMGRQTLGSGRACVAVTSGGL